MSIVAHTVTTSPQSAARMHVLYNFLDHVGGTISVRKLLPITFDTDADALSMYTSIEEGLADKEDNKALEAIDAGVDVELLVRNPVHSTSKQIAKKLIYYMMWERNPYLVIALEPLIVYLKATYTSAQLRDFLDLTVAQASKMNNRINAILNNKTVFTDYDAASEEIE